LKAFENNVKRKSVMLESKAMQVKPAKQPLANSHPASEKEEAKLCDKPMLREYMCKKIKKIKRKEKQRMLLRPFVDA
jgi:hypothetical protein